MLRQNMRRGTVGEGLDVPLGDPTAGYYFTDVNGQQWGIARGGDLVWRAFSAKGLYSAESVLLKAASEAEVLEMIGAYAGAWKRDHGLMIGSGAMSLLGSMSSSMPSGLIFPTEEPALAPIFPTEPTPTSEVPITVVEDEPEIFPTEEPPVDGPAVPDEPEEGVTSPPDEPEEKPTKAKSKTEPSSGIGTYLMGAGLSVLGFMTLGPLGLTAGLLPMLFSSSEK